jgi:hypothetical protein
VFLVTAVSRGLWPFCLPDVNQCNLYFCGGMLKDRMYGNHLYTEDSLRGNNMHNIVFPVSLAEICVLEVTCLPDGNNFQPLL